MPETPDNLNTAPEFAPLADALRSLEPASTTISRDRLLFEAGRAAAKPAFPWVWPSGTAFFGGLSLVLSFFVLSADRPTTTIVERERTIVVHVPAPVEPPVTPIPSSPGISEVAQVDSNLSPEAVRAFHLRQDVTRWGPEMLPASKTTANAVSSHDAARDLDRWLEVPPGTFTAPYQKKSPRLIPNILGDD